MSESTQKCPSCSETVPLEYSVCPFCGFGLLEYELRKFAYKPKLKEVFIRIYSFFRHPLKTSEEMAVATESKGANIIMLIFSLFLSLRFYMIIVKSGLEFSSFVIGNPEKFSINISLSLILFFVSLLLMPFVVWIIYKILFTVGTWIMAKFASMLGSEATTKQYRTIIGYSIAPIAVGEFLGIFFTLVGPGGGLGVPSSVTFETFRQFVENLYGSIVMIIFQVLMVVLWVIVAIYASLSLRKIGKMAWINAVLAIIVPIGLFVYFFYLLGLFI